MKPPFETMDRVALVISAFMLVVGFAGLLLPDDLIVAHTSMRGKGVRAYTVLEHVTPSRARMYGLGSVIVGLRLLFTFCGPQAQSEATQGDTANRIPN